jgi:hypothetical protein
MQAKGNDAMVMFDGDWLTLVHSGFGAIARGGAGPKRIHVRNIADIELKEPRVAAGWFIVVPVYKVPGVSPAPHRDPYTARFSNCALGDFTAIQVAVQSAVLALRQPHAEPAAPHI